MSENCRKSYTGGPRTGKRSLLCTGLAGLGLLLLALVAGWAWPVPGARAASETGAPTPAAPQSAVELEGHLEPRRFAEISAVQPARVKAVLAGEGDRVEAGQVLVQLDGAQSALAELDSAEFEKILAQTAIEDLYRNTEVQLAQATLDLRKAEWEQAMAEDRLAGVKRPPDSQSIDQVYANLLLAENQLEDAREDLSSLQKKFDNKKSLVSKYVSRHRLRLMLNSLEQRVAYFERRYWDAREKYDDLLAPPDPVDVSVAEAGLASAQAKVNEAERQRARLLNGPDPDQLETAQARLEEAEARRVAAESALEMTRLKAPVSGVVVDVAVKPGEWASPGQQLAVVADLSEWIVETGEVDEQDLAGLKVGQQLPVSLDAYPEIALQGTVESISLFSKEEEGDVYYTARLGLPDAPPFLRWGMTTRLRLANP